MDFGPLLSIGGSLLGGALGAFGGGGGGDGLDSHRGRQAYINMQGILAEQQRLETLKMLEELGVMDYVRNLKTLSGEADRLFNSSDITPYLGDTGTGLTKDMDTALKLISERALLGNAGLDVAKGVVGDTASGKYLDPKTNPYLQFYVNEAIERSLPVYRTTGVGAGRYGSNAYYAGQNNLMSDLVNTIYGGAYENERTRQLNAAQLLPSLYEMDYNDLSRLLDAGDVRRQIESATHTAKQMAPWQKAQLYQGLISNQYPNASTYQFSTPQMPSYSTYPSNTPGNILGGMMAGYGLGNMFKSGQQASNAGVSFLGDVAKNMNLSFLN